MDTELRDLLKEYEKKHSQALLDLENRKQQLYIKYPRLQEIDSALAQLTISIVKCSLQQKEPSDAHLFQVQQESLKKEKRSLLQDLKISSDFFKPHYECTQCEDTGYITKNYITSMCSCLKQKLLDRQYNKCNIGNLQKENFSFFQDSFYSPIPDTVKYHSDISPQENIQRIKEICLSFIQHFDNPEEKNLLFTGNTGLGKTFLSNCIAKELLEANKTVLYQTAPVMLDSIINDKFGKTNSHILDTILEVDLLIIDDLGTEYQNNLKFAELYEIINTRLLNQNQKITKTIISTNLTLNNLFSTYDERIVSRIVGYYNICKFFGEDIRFQKR